MARSLFELNPQVDRTAAARRFARDRRVQVRDVLTQETAQEIREILMRGTPWGVGWQAGLEAEPQHARAEQLQGTSAQALGREIAETTHKSAAHGDYAFRYARYPMVQAYMEKWAEGSPHDLLIEYLNTPETLDLVREVTGMADLKKADAQATLFAPGHFLGRHIDSHVEEGWKVAYVLNFAPDDWHPDWGGYLNFLDEDGDIVAGYRPRFNCLNMFAVPQAHLVSFVPPFAPTARFAITGWFRNQ